MGISPGTNFAPWSILYPVKWLLYFLAVLLPCKVIIAPNDLFEMAACIVMDPWVYLTAADKLVKGMLLINITLSRCTKYGES